MTKLKVNPSIVGVSRNGFDNSACVLQNGKIVTAISKERLTRRRHDGLNNPLPGKEDQETIDMINYCLESADISPRDIDLIVKSNFFYGDRKEYNRTLEISHHLAHAYSAFPDSTFPECVILVADGTGSPYDLVSPKYRGTVLDVPQPQFEAESYYHYKSGQLDVIHKRWHERFYDKRSFFRFEHFWDADISLGIAYSIISEIIFGPKVGMEGKVMGLAPYGNPETYKHLSLIDLQSGDIRFQLNDLAKLPLVAEHYETGKNYFWNDQDRRQECADLAYKIQEEVERAVLHMARWLYDQTQCPNLCLAGGVALNCQLNGKLLTETPFEHIYIPSAPGDDGVALGCAYYGYLQVLGNTLDAQRKYTPYLGKTYTDREILPVLKSYDVLTVERLDDPARTAAELLSDNQIVAWFQGGSEFGPRALGNRSLLCSPKDIRIKDALNEHIKHREKFRPFAPSVLREHCSDYFEVEVDSPFMSFAVKVKDSAVARIPAVVHVDATARLQTVTVEQNSLFHRLLQEFQSLTGLPVILNTSFNVSEPIVETPQHAVEAFLKMGIDYLVLNNFLITRGKDRSLKQSEG